MVRIEVRAREELYKLIVAEAERNNVSMGDVLTAIAAEHFGRPELGGIDKGKPGPKPGRARPEATVGAR